MHHEAHERTLHTYYLGSEEVSAFSRDLCKRLTKVLTDSPPVVICPIGVSGAEMLNALTESESVPTQIGSPKAVVPVSYVRDIDTAQFVAEDDAKLLRGETVFVIDSCVHSGKSMLAVARKAMTCGAARIISYSLIAKRGSCFIPSFFGQLIDDHDSAYFLLQEIPNRRTIPFGILRKLCKEDVHDKRRVKSGLPSVDDITWADLWYESVTRNRQVYLYEAGDKILAYISFELEPQRGRLFVDVVAVDESVQNQRIGGRLMRWAEMWGRKAGCHRIDLWAFAERVDYYKKKLRFEVTGDDPMDLGGETYHRMQRRLLYNTPWLDDE